MAWNHIGTLPSDAPLHRFLTAAVVPPGDRGAVAFEMYDLGASRDVRLFAESHRNLRVVGKFFGGPHSTDGEGAQLRMQKEHDWLCRLRDLGFVGHPHHVVAPLAQSHELDDLLLLEYWDGTPLSVFLEAATRGDGEPLRDALALLAEFLARCHRRTGGDTPVDVSRGRGYLRHLLDQLTYDGHVDLATAGEFLALQQQCELLPELWDDHQVVVHGDATPANFLLTDDSRLVVIDLERAHQGDRTWDVGRVVGELQHAYLWDSGDTEAAEPMISHFVGEYARHFPEPEAFHARLTRRLSVHVAATLLRIARNDWITLEHRERLLAEATGTLRGSLWT